MKHANGFIDLVNECLPRIKEISAAEVMAHLTSPVRGEVEAQRAEGGGKSADRTHPLPNPPPERGREFLLIDIREDREWMAGHAEGAVHIGRGVLERDIENVAPSRDTPIVLYCGGGYRSALAADSLQKMGYGNVYSIAGGWRDWCANDFPRVIP